jgi:HTH DNA binding domain
MVGPGPRVTLKRLVLEAPRSDLENFEGLPSLNVVESFKVVHQFRFHPKALAGICQVKFRSRSVSPGSMAGHAGLTKVEELAHLEDGAFLAYYEGRPTAGFAKLAVATGAHLHPPFEITPKSWRITVLGNPSQLRRFLTTLRRLRIHYRVQSLGGANFRAESPLGALTPKQRETLVTAYRAGYYDVPRRANSSRVAASLGRGKATTVEHLRKAEKRLLDDIFRS